MSNTGWIKLHRKITDHWLWEDKPFARGQAMIDLLILAGYQIFKDTGKRQYHTCKKRH